MASEEEEEEEEDITIAFGGTCASSPFDVVSVGLEKHFDEVVNI